MANQIEGAGAKAARLLQRSHELWDEDLGDNGTFTKYIEVPAVSPKFRPDWEKEGHIDAAAQLIFDRIEKEKAHIPGMTAELLRSEGKTPFIYIDVPANNVKERAVWENSNPQVLIYGHMDKQPEMLPWREGLEPFKAVREGDKLYGRGGADDGYAVFAALKALRLNVENGEPNPHTAIIIEASEESGSPDLDHYMEILSPRIGRPETVMILDSGSGDYERPWVTEGLRGYVAGTLKVEVVTEGLHSGGVGGIVPPAFRIMRQLMDRIEDSKTGEILLPEFHIPITESDRAKAKQTAEVLGDTMFSEIPWAGSTKPMSTDPVEVLLNKGLRPTLTVVGADGFPAIQGAGNVMLPGHSWRLSLRIPPGVDNKVAGEALKRVLEANPPSDAIVEFDLDHGADGWRAPKSPEWLEKSIENAAQETFGTSAGAMWEGGTIPLANDVQRNIPEANFLVTGILGPNSNAHGPNEFTHVPYVEKLTAFISRVVRDHVNHGSPAEESFTDF